jgi:hypothetical protein
MGKAGNSTPLASDISSLEDSTFKVGKLSVEQRKEKIHRYMKKRNERNFSKKIKVFSLSLHYAQSKKLCIPYHHHSIFSCHKYI